MSASATALDAIVEELQQADKLLITTHENPDGDALGSLLGVRRDDARARQGLDDVHVGDQFPLPHEYQHLPLDGVVNEPPADMEERTAVFLDCGNIDRMPVDFLQREGQHILNIDHHHDNTRFGTVNLVVRRRVVHRGDPLGARARARRGDHAVDGRGALHRADHRHRPLHVREHRRPRHT